MFKKQTTDDSTSHWLLDSVIHRLRSTSWYHHAANTIQRYTRTIPAHWRARLLITVPVLLLMLLGSWWTHSPNRTLVMYIFQPRVDDPEYTNNALYFIRHGIKVGRPQHPSSDMHHTPSTAAP